jgi:uncharacterized lipoprotein YddW (UPF0748 family)
MREFRGAWVATVGNIDWPSTNNLSVANQKAELIAILDRAVALKLNAIVFQVRPACDAIYASQIEPWSEFLTGAMGRAPQPFYDPLTFAIDEAHKRGIELHAWFNPYRAGHPSAKSQPSPNHISRTRPELVRRYGKQLWLDPGERDVQEYSLRVVMDVVNRYDIDGVHFDDYFYPYKEKDASGAEMDFPDDASWKKFGAQSGLGRDDWRRENVNTLVRNLYKSIKAQKPWVKFGISPFGIWRPGVPQQIEGFDAYSKLYADSRKWLASGWVDYFAPQLYWSIDSKGQSFPVLLKWWSAQNPKHRNLYAGISDTRVRSERDDAGGRGRRGGPWAADEIVNQISLTRTTRGADGVIHWNMKSLMKNNSLDQALEAKVYAQPALVPASPWLQKNTLSKPLLQVASGNISGSTKITWSEPPGVQPWLWLIQTRNGETWSNEILPAMKTSETWTTTLPEGIVVTAVDRDGNLSMPSAMRRTAR